ncbi:kinase-like domain-containing protein [Fusarium heterosporum]|uniref:Kinase-like domain-containing protein n=1 Tax=Fusarium heterosporum TaxID=42747 RepID=A0A8H5TEC8_FUSHE|nr:kinase-like domain-containing protein [Fusarium heterosporum]
MSTNLVSIDPDGDVLIILPVTGSITWFKPEDPPALPAEKRFKCSKKHLTLASPRAAKIFSSSFKEASKEDDGFHHWKFDATFDGKAFELVLKIIHGKSSEVPRHIDQNLLTAVASIVDDLQCHDALNFFGNGWISSLYGLFRPALPKEMNKSLVQYILISSVFQHAILFEASTEAAIRYNNGTPSLPSTATLDFVIDALRQTKSPIYFGPQELSVSGKHSGSWVLSARSNAARPTADPKVTFSGGLFGSQPPPPVTALTTHRYISITAAMDPAFEQTVEQALCLIRDERDLPHPLGPLLECFIAKALQPQIAAAHVLRLCRSDAPRKDILARLALDWAFAVEAFTKFGKRPPRPDHFVQEQIVERDGNRCCITGKVASLREALTVAPILYIPIRWLDAEPSIVEMLRAFFGPPYLQWWLDCARTPERTNPYLSHWLVRSSVVEYFKRGLLTLDRLQPSMVEYRVTPCLIGTSEPMVDVEGEYPLLGDHSRSGKPKVDPRFVGTHARLATSIRWLEVNAQIARDETIVSSRIQSRGETYTPSLASKLIKTLRGSIWQVWLFMPVFARCYAYKLLKKVGNHMYGRSSSFSVQRLPFDLYLKCTTSEEAWNESNALTLIHKYTSIPAPFSLDIVAEGDRTYVLTTCLPGTPLSRTMDMFSDRSHRDFIGQMQSLIAQLRAIPRPQDIDYRISNTSGKACTDPRIRDGNPIGPFRNEEEFSQYLYYPEDPARRGHDIVFTHADLNPRNILVDRATRVDGTIGWNVTGIVDWENSGFYPEHWDCTKAQFEGWRWEERWRRALFDVFRPFSDYSKELELEKKSWRAGDGA